MYDKLPISAFVSAPEVPSPDMDLPNLQFWNCMDYGVVAVTKQFIGSMTMNCIQETWHSERHLHLYYRQLSPRS